MEQCPCGPIYELCFNQVPHQKKDGCTLSLLSIGNVGGGAVKAARAARPGWPSLLRQAAVRGGLAKDPPGQNTSCGDPDHLSDQLR